MSPQARQQLQQLTPQMRYVVLQRILQQQEVSMQRSQSQNQPQQTQPPGQNPAQIINHSNQQQAGFGSPQGPINQLNQGKLFFIFLFYFS